MAFPLRPILGRVIVKLDPIGEKVGKSGIIVHLDSKRSAQQRGGMNRTGTVVALHEGHRNSARGIGVGDRVFFQTSWQGEGWEYEGEHFHTLEGYDVALVMDTDTDLEAVSR